MKLNEWVNNYIKEITHSHEYEDMSQMGEDENDPQEIKVGNYQTKYFHVCPGASNLYKDIESKGVDMDMAERSARLQDALYFIEEHIQRDGYEPERDYVMVANNIAKNIMKLAKMMGLEKEHDFIQGHVDTIEKVVKQKGLEESIMNLTEKNVPTDPSKWSYYKSQAKKKFDVYPSAYANAWAAKKYKAAGGSWRKSESVNEGIWPKSKLADRFEFILSDELKKNFKGIFYVVGYDLYHNDKKVMTINPDKDSVNSIVKTLKSKLKESVNEADVVGKTIFSDGKGKLHFGYYKTDDAVEFVDYKTWKKLSFKDVSKGDTNKDRVIKAILRKQKQFNKKVDYNMWSKKNNPSFEQKMDWFIKNGWISNINKGGIKESVNESINEVEMGDMGYVEKHKSIATVYGVMSGGKKVKVKLGKTGKVVVIDTKDIQILPESINERSIKKSFKVKMYGPRMRTKGSDDVVQMIAKKLKIDRGNSAKDSAKYDEIEKQVEAQYDANKREINFKINLNESVNEAEEPEIISQLKNIVAKKQNQKLKDPKSGKMMRVDLYSASAVTQVYDALKQQKNKDKFVGLGLVGMVNMAFKLLKNESVNEGTKYKVGQKTPVGKIIGTSVWGKGRKQEWFYDVQKPGYAPKQYSEKSLDKIMGESVNEAYVVMYAKNKGQKPTFSKTGA